MKIKDMRRFTNNNERTTHYSPKRRGRRSYPVEPKAKPVKKGEK